MDKAILAQMSTKEIPKPQQPINIAVKKAEPKKPVNIDVKVVDKRFTADIDRKKLLAKVKKDVVSEIPTEEIKEEEEFDLSEDAESKVVALGDIVVPKPQDSAMPVGSVKKEKKKLVLRPATAAQTKLSPKYSVAKPLPLGDLEQKMPIKEPILSLSISPYYMNNREIFINYITLLFEPYKKEIKQNQEKYNCAQKDNNEFSALAHQKMVRDYLNLYTPYRGLLLYHGLGSGKTCASIGIAEALKTDKQIIIMLPASLEDNYIEELQKCGDLLYKKNQYWEFISTKTNPELLEPLSYALSLTTKFITEQGGAWFVNINKPPNYNKLPSMQQISLNNQLREMIKYKYEFIRYNGLTQKKYNFITKQDTINPFDNKVVIIDEAHNLISRIINKLKKPNSISMKLYNYLQGAENARIVLLTGTPIINSPIEIAIMMNILRGYIKTWSIPLSNEGRKVNQEVLIDLFRSIRNCAPRY